jgi:hypothetical protein
MPAPATVGRKIFCIEARVLSASVFIDGTRRASKLSRNGPTIEGTTAVLYLKGERNTTSGINKFILTCPQEGRVRLLIIFDPQRREEEVMHFLNAHSLIIDGKGYHITAVRKEIKNGLYNGDYALTREQVQRIKDGKSVGLTLQFSYEAPFYLGFYSMPTRDGDEKISAFLNSCRYEVHPVSTGHRH